MCQPWPVTDGSRKAVLVRVLRQPRDRHRQVRRVPDHQLGRAARRGRPLAGRHRQPGAAAARRLRAPSGRPTPATRSATGASATSGPSSWRSCCSRWAGCSPSTRASPSCATRTRWRTCRSPSASSLFAIVLESISLRTAYKEAHAAQAADGSWWRWIRNDEGARAPGRPARGRRRRDRPVLRADRRAARPLHRRTPLGRRRLARHRRAARRDRHRAGHRDEGPADRRGRLARPTSTRSPTPSLGAPSVRRLIHLRTEHLGPDQLLVARQGRVRARPHGRRARRRHRRGRAGRPRRRARRPGSSTSSPTSSTPRPPTSAGPQGEPTNGTVVRWCRVGIALMLAAVLMFSSSSTHRQVGRGARLRRRLLADDRRRRRCGGSSSPFAAPPPAGRRRRPRRGRPCSRPGCSSASTSRCSSPP